MNKTINKNYNTPDREDKVIIGDLNANFEALDKHIKELEDMKAPIVSPHFSGEPTIIRNSVSEKIATVPDVINALEVEVLEEETTEI